MIRNQGSDGRISRRAQGRGEIRRIDLTRREQPYVEPIPDCGPIPDNTRLGIHFLTVTSEREGGSNCVPRDAA